MALLLVALSQAALVGGWHHLAGEIHLVGTMQSERKLQRTVLACALQPGPVWTGQSTEYPKSGIAPSLTRTIQKRAQWADGSVIYEAECRASTPAGGEYSVRTGWRQLADERRLIFVLPDAP